MNKKGALVLLIGSVLVVSGCATRFDRGYTAFQEGRYDEAAIVFHDLGQQPGQSMAKNNMGYMYENGLSVETSLPKAVSWYERAVAADPSNAIAQTNLGTMLLYGYGTERDLSRARGAFQVAAQQNDRRAQFYLGYMYEKGLGVPKSHSEAMNMYRASANQGFEEAKIRIQLITSSAYRQRQRQIQNVIRALSSSGGKIIYDGYHDYSQDCSSRKNWNCNERLRATSVFGQINGELIGYYEVESFDGSIIQGLYDFSNAEINDDRLTFSWSDEFGRGGFQLKTQDAWSSFQGIWSGDDDGGVLKPVGRWNARSQQSYTLAKLLPKPAGSVVAERLDLSVNQREFLSALEREISPSKNAVDQDPPTLTLSYQKTSNVRGILNGRAIDQSGIAELLVDGRPVAVEQDGTFEFSTYVPLGGKTLSVIAIDGAGLSTTQSITMSRVEEQASRPRLAAANPLKGPKQPVSENRAALIIGLENYAVTQAAEFAARDATIFADYAREKLGVPAENVRVLTDSQASERGILRALKVWLPQVVAPGETDLYVFYAGHGMPTADGDSAYLVPYDGDVQLLEDTAISRTRFFSEIQRVQPKSATFFFDNCFSGATRSEKLLLASRPLGIKVKEEKIPDNYLVFSAGESSQTAGVLNEVQHGRFSYFVFKGLEGEADSNRDGKISAGELHRYVRESVGRFSAGSQTPTVLGGLNRWVIQ
mgnify:CR=1 FL=1